MAQESGLVKVYLLILFAWIGISTLVLNAEQRSKIRYNAHDKENVNDTRCLEAGSS